MGASVILSSDKLSVDPGGVVTCELSVRNTGNVVDEFTMSVLGESEGWASVEPPVLSLFPGAEEKTQLRFRPPRSADTPAGEVPFGVRVRSREDPQGSVVEEGTLAVGTFSDVFAELVPRASRGRRTASHTLALDNRGNAPVNATLKAKDPNDLLLFDFEDPSLLAEPNTAAFAKLKVKPRKGFLRGPARTHSFQVFVDANGAGPSSAEASMLQEPLIPKWLPKALLLLVALIILWYVMFKPEVRSAARSAVKEDIEEQNQQLAAVNSKLDQVAAAQAAGAGASAGAGAGTTAGTTATTLPPGAAAGGPASGSAAGQGTPFDVRLVANAAPGALDRQVYKVPKGQQLSLTDVLLQNPAGDAGDLEIRRGNSVILRVNLSNFRDLDYHFVSPLSFKENQELVMAVSCANPVEGPRCTPAAYFAGFTEETPSG
jgi:hypothetical protein